MPTVFSRFAPLSDPNFDLMNGIIQSLDDNSSEKSGSKEPLCRLNPEMPDEEAYFIGQFFQVFMHPWAFKAWKEYRKSGWDSLKIWQKLATIGRLKRS